MRVSFLASSCDGEPIRRSFPRADALFFALFVTLFTFHSFLCLPSPSPPSLQFFSRRLDFDWFWFNFPSLFLAPFSLFTLFSSLYTLFSR